MKQVDRQKRTFIRIKFPIWWILLLVTIAALLLTWHNSDLQSEKEVVTPNPSRLRLDPL